MTHLRAAPHSVTWLDSPPAAGTPRRVWWEDYRMSRRANRPARNSSFRSWPGRPHSRTSREGAPAAATAGSEATLVKMPAARVTHSGLSRLAQYAGEGPPCRRCGSGVPRLIQPGQCPRCESECEEPTSVVQEVPACAGSARNSLRVYVEVFLSQRRVLRDVASGPHCDSERSASTVMGSGSCESARRSRAS